MSREEEITRVLKQHGERLRHLETMERSAAGTSPHKDTHDPQTGTDPLDCGAPTTILAQDTAPAESATDEFARSGHVHGLDVGIPASILAQDTAAAEGGSTEFPRKDHVHGIQVGIPSDIGVANAEGGSTEFVRKDHTHNHPGLTIEPFDAHLNNPVARAYHNAVQSIANNTWTALALNSERFDTDAIHDVAINNSRLTCKTAGKYLIIGNARFAFHATGERGIQIYFGGATIIAIDTRPTNPVNAQTMGISTLYDLGVNEYVELRVWQTSGGNLNCDNSANYSPEFMMVRVG